MNIVAVEDEVLGGYTVFYEDRPDVIAQGDTLEEAITNLEDLLEIHRTI